MLSFFALYLSIFSDSSFHASAPARIIQSQRPVPVESSSPHLPSSFQKPWTGHFSATKFRNTSNDRTTLLNIKRHIRQALEMLPPLHRKTLHDLEVRNLEHVSRGMANNEKIILHTKSIDSDEELLSVFLHEMGHVIDLGFLKGSKGKPTPFRDYKSTVLTDDPSYRFYRLSWLDSNTQKPNLKPSDFVSGYAQSNAFEDFAESFLLYRLHGEKFRSSAQKSSILYQKYEFFKHFVFEEQEFQTEKDSPLISFPHIWDVTLLPLS